MVAARGNCDGQEAYHQAAAREVREETGLRVEIISTIFEGQSHAIKTYFGKIRGGHLKTRHPECLDANFLTITTYLPWRSQPTTAP